MGGRSCVRERCGKGDREEGGRYMSGGGNGRVG